MVVSGCRKVKPKIVLVYIKNINIIAQQTNNKQNKQKKMVSRSYTNQNVPYDLASISVLDFLVSIVINSDIWLYNLCFEIRIRLTG